MQKMNSKDKAFLKKFRVKESSNLIAQENFGATEFPVMGELGRYSPHQSKNDQIFTYQNPHTKFLIWKSILQLVVYVETYPYVEKQHHSSIQS